MRQRDIPLLAVILDGCVDALSSHGRTDDGTKATQNLVIVLGGRGWRLLEPVPSLEVTSVQFLVDFTRVQILISAVCSTATRFENHVRITVEVHTWQRLREQGYKRWRYAY